MSIQQEKQRLRCALIRKALSNEETRLLQERLFSLEEYKSAKSLFVYVSVFPEPDTRKVISLALGAEKRVAVPRIEGKGVMSARLIRALYDLNPGPLSIPEPDDTAAILERADLCVMPCLACGRDFARLGHGGGYYDRYLLENPSFSVCLCPSGALFDALPQGPHDVKPNVVLTPHETLRRA